MAAASVDFPEPATPITTTAGCGPDEVAPVIGHQS